MTNKKTAVDIAKETIGEVESRLESLREDRLDALSATEGWERSMSTLTMKESVDREDSERRVMQRMREIGESNYKSAVEVHEELSKQIDMVLDFLNRAQKSKNYLELEESVEGMSEMSDSEETRQENISQLKEIRRMVYTLEGYKEVKELTI